MTAEPLHLATALMGVTRAATVLAEAIERLAITRQRQVGLRM